MSKIITDFTTLAQDWSFYARIFDHRGGGTLSPAARNLARASRRDGPQPLWQYGDDHGQFNKGILSTSLEYEYFRMTLKNALNDMYPANIGEDGFARKYPVTRSFDALDSVTGFGFVPMHTPPADNTSVTDALGVTTTGFVDAEHEMIADALFDVMFSDYTKVPHHLMKDSSMGFPFHISGEDSKRAKFTVIYAILDNMPELLDAIESDDIDKLADAFAMVLCYKNGSRDQPESSEKVRKVLTMDGKQIDADKKSMLLPFGLMNSGAMRRRTVFGMSFAVNVLISIFLVGRRYTYLNKYDFTWHHTTPDQMFNKINKFSSILGVDVTQMDQAFQPWFLEFYAKKTESIWDPRISKLLRWVNKAPYFQPSVDGESPPFFMGDPGNPDTWDVNLGLGSGRAEVPDLGKFWMVFNYLVMIHNTTRLFPFGSEKKRVMDVIHVLLRGEHPSWGMLNMGDDNVFLAHDDRLIQRMRELIKDKKATPYVSVDVEDGVAFVGNIFTKDEAGVIRQPTPDLVSMVVNRFCPEHGVTSRAFWGSGFISAMEHYENIGSEAHDVQNLCKAIWRQTIPGYQDPWVCAKDHHDRNILKVIAQSQAEADVLQDKSKLHYRYSFEDIPESTLLMLMWRIEADDIDKSIEQFHTYRNLYSTDSLKAEFGH